MDFIDLDFDFKIILINLCVNYTDACHPLWFNQCHDHSECCSGFCYKGEGDMWLDGVCKPGPKSEPITGLSIKVEGNVQLLIGFMFVQVLVILFGTINVEIIQSAARDSASRVTITCG